MSIKGKRVVITGGASGIGREIARAFQKEGAEIALIDIDGLEEARRELQCLAIEADLAKEEAIERALERLKAEHRAWDILVNNAAIVKRGPLYSVNYHCRSRQLSLPLSWQ
ncbi:MAG: SDR family NAD(P)-dependent oxidoreductase [Parachlamydiales bacterium]